MKILLICVALFAASGCSKSDIEIIARMITATGKSGKYYSTPSRTPSYIPPASSSRPSNDQRNGCNDCRYEGAR